ncbi:hypothetical protein [Bradyrhizobium canariense]|uniref:hypothetical protein n=1 Tax=Bradyrhizobium canariense TaxID=255045 RepID=UPI001B8A7966|nr:hypothetical protein [Bradyrhizobium canariense]MBR0954146.1 hypothetical protein [Bradyrhizobium canariense]
MNKKHLLWWIFDFLQREHPAALQDMQARLAGDLGDDWVTAALAERLAAFEDARPAGYKFTAEYKGDGAPTKFKDLVIYDSDRRLAETEAAQQLRGATKLDMIILSKDDLKQFNLEPGQMRTTDGIVAIDKHKTRG